MLYVHGLTNLHSVATLSRFGAAHMAFPARYEVQQGWGAQGGEQVSNTSFDEFSTNFDEYRFFCYFYVILHEARKMIWQNAKCLSWHRPTGGDDYGSRRKRNQIDRQR